MSTMIDARGWNATFKTEHGEHTEPLLFWLLVDGAPVGYHLSNRTARPISAERASNFDGYARDDDADTTILPAEPGWWIVSRDRDPPTQAYWAKVIAWQCLEGGFGVKALTVPDVYGFSAFDEVEKDQVQFVFDPSRIADGDGVWPETPLCLEKAA